MVRKLLSCKSKTSKTILMVKKNQSTRKRLSMYKEIYLIFTKGQGSHYHSWFTDRLNTGTTLTS